MDLYFEIMTGESKGKQFKLANGMKVGRRKCDINIDDPKISSYHATVISRGSGNQLKLYLRDNNSSNGIKFNDLRVPELPLTPGTEFRLGQTTLTVLDLSPPPAKIEAKVLKPLKVSPPSIEAQEKPTLPAAPVELLPEPAPEPIPEPPPTWRQLLEKLIQNIALRAEDIVNEEIAAFNPPVKFRCVRGQQFGKTWLLGYGPRSIGPKSLDFVLGEDSAPPISFSVVPTLGGAEFRTLHSEVVKLNGEAIDNAILRAGDIISVLNSDFVVDFDYARN